MKFAVLTSSHPAAQRADGLLERLSQAEPLTVLPLRLSARLVNGDVVERDAFNDAWLHRSTREMGHIEVLIDGSSELKCLRADGVIVATAVGSTAYNRSAGGPILPLGRGAGPDANLPLPASGLEGGSSAKPYLV